MKKLINYLYPAILISFLMGCTLEKEQEAKTPQEHFPTLEEMDAGFEEAIASIDARQPYGHIPKDQRLDYGFYIPKYVADSVNEGHFSLSHYRKKIAIRKHEEYPLGFWYGDWDLPWPTEWKDGNYISTLESAGRKYTYHKVGKYNDYMLITDENGVEEMWTCISYSMDENEFYVMEEVNYLEKYYFPGTYQGRDVRTDSTFFITFDDRLGVGQSEVWEAYDFIYYPPTIEVLIIRTDSSSVGYYFEPGEVGSFYFHERLPDSVNGEGHYAKGELLYEFKLESRPDW